MPQADPSRLVMFDGPEPPAHGPSDELAVITAVWQDANRWRDAPSLCFTASIVAFTWSTTLKPFGFEGVKINFFATSAGTRWAFNRRASAA